MVQKANHFLFGCFQWMAFGKHVDLGKVFTPKKILIVKTHAIGDTIMITPAIRSLRKRFPNAAVVLLTGQRAAEIMEGNKDIDKIVSFDEAILFKPDLKKLLSLLLCIRRERFDAAFIFHYAYLQHLFIWLTGIGIRIGFDNAGSGFSLSHRVPWDKSGTRWTPDIQLDMARRVHAPINEKSLTIEVSNEDRRAVNILLSKCNGHKAKHLIGVFPGGGKNSRDEVTQKQWGADKFAAVIDELHQTHMARFVVFGADSDKHVVQKIVNCCGVQVINMCGVLNLKQLSAMIAACDLFITNDSAPLHIAAAMATPSVSIFGPTPAVAFVEDNDRHIGIQSPCYCSPCYNNSVFNGCQAPKCMETIAYQSVVNAARELLDRHECKQKHLGIRDADPLNHYTYDCESHL